MARRASSPPPIGNGERPNFTVEDLERVELDGLDAGFELEDVRLGGASLVDASVGAGRIRRALLEDVELAGSRLRALGLRDVAAERIDASNGDWGGAELRRVRVSDARERTSREP